LETLRLAAHAWIARDVAPDVVALNKAYADLIFAFGLARAKDADASRKILRSSADLLKKGDAAHQCLLRCFTYRVEQVLAGKPPVGPLPPQAFEPLKEDGKDAIGIEFAVDRMRLLSRVLEPQEQFYPFRPFSTSKSALYAKMDAIESLRDQGKFRERLRRLLKESKTEGKAEVRLTLLGRALTLESRVGDAFTDELLGRVVPLLEAINRSDGVKAPLVQRALLERAVQVAVARDRKDLMKDLIAYTGRWLKESGARERLDVGARMTDRVLRTLRGGGLRQEERLLVEEAMPTLPDHKQLAALREKYSNHWPEALSTLVGFAGVRVGSGKSEEAAPILDEARAILLKPVKKGSERDEATSGQATLACAYVAAVGQGTQAEAFTKVKELLEKMAFSPAYRSPGKHYSSPHVMVIEAIVLAFPPSGR
jgi:hypothetical protein